MRKNSRYERHGMTGTRIKSIWSGMRRRCLDKNNPSYPEYGGRGITVCERWQASLISFHQDMGHPPSEKHSLERVDNNGPYSPDNCIWILQKQQCRNTRRNRVITLNGESLPVSAWAEKLGMRANTICQRFQAGRTPEEILDPTPRHKFKGPGLLKYGKGKT